MNTTALPGQLIKCRGMNKQKRSNLAANPGTQYKIVPLQIAIPANIDDAMITDALNWVLSSLELKEGPIAHDWQFLARDGAVGDNDHFREAIIDEDDLFANTPQSIFEDWYLVPEGVQCPQCEKFFTAPEDIATIGDHALCTACLVAWRMTAAATTKDNGDGYSDQPPFLPIPEYWAARGLAAPTDDEADDKKPPLTIDQVKETLPNVQIESHGKTYTAKVRGRRNPFAEVSWDTDCGIMYAEFAWQTVTNAINNNEVLRA